MYPVNGQQVPGEEIEFQTEGGETFNTYILHDGTKIKFKAVVLKFIRLDMFDQNGDPIYLVQATNALSADVPEGLKRKQ
ncbi:hypothetical protein H7849_23000 [Alloacidobacterium dinghuense]|uniref:Uncharacterized protein n=1 Tax=Alloacidobacterium dinghuense TaxID=2763107 RepID=A0A7G8BH45_9BACT|nr:hypothetical protein [Alloacidobacterium dinghuense]QNI31865.1 hypothetical protein H7849_23000 [Alloacidobacterium dinghuense]